MNRITLILFCSISTLVGCSSTGDSSLSSSDTAAVELSSGSTTTPTDGAIFSDSLASADSDGSASESSSLVRESVPTVGIDSPVEPLVPDIDDPLPEPSPEQFQSGTLTAADYDDQLNPHLYQSYVSDYLQRVGNSLDAPYIDLSNRIALSVRDENGVQYGGVQLSFNDGNNDILTLTTPATGITYLYPELDELPDQFTIRATSALGTAIDQTVSLSDAQASGAIDITLAEDSSILATQDSPLLDIMFVIDTTGSMGDELNYLQTELTSIITAIPYEESLVNIGLIFYRDIGDDYVVRYHGFTNDIAAAQQTLSNESHDGGGDYPEAMDQALQQAIDANWNTDSKRIAFLIADAPPHAENVRATWNAAEQARLKNIHIVPVAASGVAEDAEYLMRSMAAYTNSRYLFLTDDSGYGNSHAEPEIDCYVVTHLKNLMIRVMNSLITGTRDEPTEEEIIRRVGNYDNGVCEAEQPEQ